MVFKTIENAVGENFQTVKLSTGLTLILNAKKGFAKTLGVMGVKFGAADNVLPDGESGSDDKTRRLPDGTAHFLEHKLFEDAEGDVSDRFAANGAHCNASTGFTSTSYMFSCTDKVCDNLRLLLAFVQDPYFTDELVRKEQGIIQQEIKMYDDDPGWIVYFNLMRALYREHPARHNIAGTVESIAEITPDFLDRCYRAFYRPGNMALVMVGGFDPMEVYEEVSRDAASRRVDDKGLNEHFFTETDCSPASRSMRAEMVVSRPKFMLGFKEAALARNGRDVERLELVSQIILDVLLSKSSRIYESLYEEELIDESFAAYHSAYGDFGFSLISADTKEPEVLTERLVAIFEKARTGGIDRDDFERIRNKYVGSYIRMFNSIESTAYSFLGCHFLGLYPSELVDMIRSLTLEEINERLAGHFDPERMATSVVMPIQKGN